MPSSSQSPILARERVSYRIELTLYKYSMCLLLVNRPYLRAREFFIALSLLYISTVWATDTRAQGLSLFSSLRLPVDASVAALGDYNVSHMGGNPSLTWQNTALIATDPATQLSVSVLDYYAGIRAGSAFFRLAVGKGSLGLGFRYLSYGRFEGYNEQGVSVGDFSAQTQLFQIAYGRSLGLFSWGISLRPAYVFVDRVSAYGAFADLGATFTHPDRSFRLGIALKHVALWLRSADVSRPLDVWIGMSYGPEGFPFRFSATLYGLTQSTYYYDESSPVLSHREPARFLDQVLSKSNLGVELLLGKWLRLQSALTVARRQQLQLDEVPGLSGFSFGLAWQMRHFSLHLAQRFHEVRSGRIHVGLQLNFDAFRVKRESTIDTLDEPSSPRELGS